MAPLAPPGYAYGVQKVDRTRAREGQQGPGRWNYAGEVFL